MKWLTRARVRMDRVACAWLVARYVDRDAEFLFVDGDDILARATEVGATPFVVPHAELGRRGDRITFEVMLDKYGLIDPALKKMAAIMRAADVTALRGTCPEAEGVRAIVHGFFLLNLPDEQSLQLQMPVMDAVYRYCQEQTRLDA